MQYFICTATSYNPNICFRYLCIMQHNISNVCEPQTVAFNKLVIVYFFYLYEEELLKCSHNICHCMHVQVHVHVS